jgi:hypothetical protein
LLGASGSSDCRALQNQARELHWLLGKKTLEAEILKEALEHGLKKRVARPVCKGFARGNLIASTYPASHEGAFVKLLQEPVLKICTGR